jgi:hypothetical protein
MDAEHHSQVANSASYLVCTVHSWLSQINVLSFLYSSTYSLTLLKNMYYFIIYIVVIVVKQSVMANMADSGMALMLMMETMSL